ncbi:hypothetical protein AB0C76_30875 [Kitasatospora sp. NPDC048722]|uniref:hypothetical protein n=1 Tax=Kitasatospora sp. NPDC048722 TaxID=3155639 RepID=UPI00340DDC22
MITFTCATCDDALSAGLREARPAADGGQRATRHGIGRPRTAQGRYAAGRDGAVFVLHPDDVPGTRRHPGSGRRNGRCGLDGLDGPNLVRTGCGAEVATEEADRRTSNLVALIASAVRAALEVAGGEG